MVAITAFLSASAHANEAAHEMAQRFAGDTKGAAAKPQPTETAATEAKSAAEPADAAKREAERKALTARKEAARKKAEAARRTADAKRRAALEAAEAARATERRREEETEMLARARLEAEQMRAAAEEARLTEEARRLVIEAERERAKAEELLAGHPDAPAAPIAREPQHAGGGEAERGSRERAEETRRLVEKLKRVRQIHATRLANRTRREAEVGGAVLRRAPQPLASPPLGMERAPGAVGLPTQSIPAATPLQGRPPPPVPQEAAVPVPAATSAPAAASAQVQPPSEAPAATGTAIATAQPGPPPFPAGGVAAPPPLAKPDAAAAGERTPPHVAAAPPASAARPPVKPPEQTALVGADRNRVTVLLVMVPGSYGIRRGGVQVADPVLCLRDGCYISAGADRPATFLPGRKALGFRNTWGARAGACRNALGCIFRSVELGTLPTFVQPVDLHIFRHDLRAGFAVLADSDCAITAGRLGCRHGIDAETYTMWIVPERLAQALGPAGLERAVSEGLNGPRSALFAPR
ncbi:MAG TPA: hypothetical protein VLL28_15815 [Hyphomicrobiaceae bacterium]|nr:hypothetical protein [Hyphomicrobiaceae bacterium]